MFDPGGAVRPECSYQGGGVVPLRARDDKSPTVPSRASPKQSEGDIGGFWGEVKKIITSLVVYLFGNKLKAQAQPAIGSRATALQ